MKDASEFELLIEDNKVPRRSFSDEIARYTFATKYVIDKVVLDVGCGTGHASGIECLKTGDSYVWDFTGK